MKYREELVTNTYGRKYWIYADDTFYHQRIANAGPYQKHNLLRLRELAPNARLILDVGMNIGMNTIEYATWGKEVWGFEPTPQTYDMACKNIAMAMEQQDSDLIKHWHFNSSMKCTGHVVTQQMAMGDKKGEFDLVIERNNAGQNHLVGVKPSRVEKETVKVEVDTIDSYNFENVDIIKVDTEGFEFPVVKGAERTILEQRPVVQCEMIESQLKRFGYDCQDVYNWFLERDFVITLSDGTRCPNTWQKVSKKVERFFVHKSKMKTLRIDED